MLELVSLAPKSRSGFFTPTMMVVLTLTLAAHLIAWTFIDISPATFPVMRLITLSHVEADLGAPRSDDGFDSSLPHLGGMVPIREPNVKLPDSPTFFPSEESALCGAATVPRGAQFDALEKIPYQTSAPLFKPERMLKCFYLPEPLHIPDLPDQPMVITIHLTPSGEICWASEELSFLAQLRFPPSDEILREGVIEIR